MIVASAQTVPARDNIQQNLDDHYRLTNLAADNGALLIVFPELSLTSYELEKASSLAFSAADPRLAPLRGLAVNRNIIIIAGAPIQLDAGLHIGLFVALPDGCLSIYTKQFLHQGEEKFFVPGATFNPQIKLADETISLAICADITNPLHPQNAAATGSTMYIASIFYSPGGIAEGYEQLTNYAKKHKLNVLMSNYGGSSWGMSSAGKSAFWTNAGKLAGGFEGTGEGLLVATKHKGIWSCTKIETNN